MNPMSWSRREADSSPYRTRPTNEPHENMLARALKAISFDEHQSAIHDLHGVSADDKDDPMMVEQKLFEMEVEICKITSKDAYLKAKALSQAYVENKDFRLLFLRTDTFHPKKAAERFVRHFETKKRLFGEEKLGRDIRFSDLDPEDYKFCQTRWLKHRDRSGRIVLFWTPNAQGQSLSVESRFRLMFWSTFLVLRDEETRKKGMVLIFYNVGSTRTPDTKFCFALNELLKGFPNPFVSFHICYDNPRVHPIISIVLAAIGNFLTVRCRSHYGSANECIFSLMTFGIPREALPITDDGKLIPINEERFLRRLEQEKQPKPKEHMVIIPGRFDVLLGRQKRCQDHVGNLRYRQLVLGYQNEYENASKYEKTAIAQRIIKEVRSKGGHFLTDYYEDFIEVSDVVARKKVAHAFRSQRRIQNRRRESESRAAAKSPSPDQPSSDSDTSFPVAIQRIAGSKRNSSTMPSQPRAKRGLETRL